MKGLASHLNVLQNMVRRDSILHVQLQNYGEKNTAEKSMSSGDEQHVYCTVTDSLNCGRTNTKRHVEK